MPVFRDSYSSGEDDAFKVPYLRVSVLNDRDDPPKTLIDFNVYLVPAADEKDGSMNKKSYDDVTDVCLIPEDAIRLAKTINMLVSEIFNDENYIRK